MKQLRYQQIVSDLKEKIEAGEFVNTIPPWVELRKTYKTSFRTLMQVSEALKSEDLIRPTSAGTFIKKRSN